MLSATEAKMKYDKAVKQLLNEELLQNTQLEIETLIADCCTHTPPKVPTCHCQYIAPDLNQFELKYISDLFKNYGYGVALNGNTFTLTW